MRRTHRLLGGEWPVITYEVLADAELLFPPHDPFHVKRGDKLVIDAGHERDLVHVPATTLLEVTRLTHEEFLATATPEQLATIAMIGRT